MKRIQEKEGMNSKQKWRLTLQRSQVHILKPLIALRKNVKATGPDNLPIDVSNSFGRTGENFKKEALYKITDDGKIPVIWLKTYLIPIFKKGDIVNCGNYRDAKPICHNTKLYETRLRTIVRIHEEQFRFMKVHD